MKITNLAILGVGIMACLPLSLAYAADTNIFAAGNFEALDNDNEPLGWTGFSPNAELAQERKPDGSINHFVVVAPKDDRFVPWISYKLPLEKDWKSLQISARLKATGVKIGEQSWQGPRVALEFLDENGKTAAYAGGPNLDADSDWKTVSMRCDVPDNARTLLLQVAVLGPAGELSADDIGVVPNPSAQAVEAVLPTTMAAVASSDGTFDTVTGWKGIGDGKSVETEGGNRFLRFSNANTDASVFLDGRLNLDPRWTRVTLSAKMRGTIEARGKEGWFAPRITFTFRDKDDNMVGDWPDVPVLSTSSKEWQTIARSYAVPVGATHLSLQPGLWGTSGTLDVDDIQVESAEAFAARPQANIAPRDATAPPDQQVTWGREPVEVLSTTRGRVVLNGLWRWMPANGSTPDGGWGLIRVPGSWHSSGLPGLVAQGEGNDWRNFDSANCNRGWYERPLHIPQSWAGQRIELDVSRVSTDAQIWVNDQKMGEINWPSGTVDISRAVTPGKTATLRMLVVAVPDEGDVLQYMDGDDIIRRKAELKTAGIIGDVILQSSPQGARLSDVFVKPSFRQKKLGLQVEVTGAQNGQVQWTARLLNEKGIEEKRFTAKSNVSAGDSEVNLSFPWATPRLWDVGQPNLYTLRLEASGAGLRDDYAQEFGFREFWIQGRDYFLNGTKFRARPTLSGSDSGVREIVDAELRQFMDFGFNLVEQWPDDYTERSRPEFRSVLSASADRLGMPITGVVNNMGMALDNPNQLKSRALYNERMSADMKRFRNHPSIVMWGTTANRFGWADDQNPRNIGRSGFLDGNLGWKRQADLARELLGDIKKVDATRPVFTHHGDYVGDVFTSNTYLNMIPLQERIEWLSEWSVKGEMPYWAIEFGTPLYSTLMRGRAGYGPTSNSEPLISEFSAIYLGSAAYTGESEAYRQQIRARFRKGQEYSGWHLEPTIRHAPNFQALQALFHKQTNRAWRTWGISGGMIPWDDGYRLAEKNRQTVEIGPFVPGRLGVYRSSGQIYKPELSPAGVALKANSLSTLAYIGGAPHFTEQSHSFRAGTTVQKQVVLLNDGRHAQNYSFRWNVSLAGKNIQSRAATGTLKVGETAFAPIRFSLPTNLGAKTNGEIKLMATIGGVTHTDSFAFRAFPNVTVARRGTIAVFDPIGATSTMLRSLGYTPQAWNGAPVPLLVVGRKALSATTKLPGSLETYVKNGGRAIVMAQDPDFMRDYLGFRTTYHPTRRVFRVSGNPVSRGLDDLDLRDWAGTGTLVEAYPTKYKIARTQEPYAGWHWGNHGSVASVALEKPHRAGWRPLLECEFDLAYSPLMELDFGRGRLTLCTLDLEDQIKPDPAAQILGTQILDYVAKGPLKPRVQTVYVGGPKGRTTLQALNVNFQSEDSLPKTAKLAIVGEGSSVGTSQLEAFARAGGHVVFLANGAGEIAGAQIESIENFEGSTKIPNWPETAGLSVSDVRWRTAGTAHLVKTGAEVGAEGQIARRIIGAGSFVWSQIDPNQFDADQNTFFRFTRWRQTRALSQILANAGATFDKDTRVFKPALAEVSRISLANSDWKAILINPQSNSPSPDKGWPDPGISNAARSLLAANADESNLQKVTAPTKWENYGTQWDKDGEGVLRLTVDVPARWANGDLLLSLGLIDDDDITFWNGEKLGSTVGWDQKRLYVVPAARVKAGKNVIAIRVWDRFGGGGFTGSADDMFLQPAQPGPPVTTLYHPDYRTDFDFGDDPYRYYRW